MFLLKKCGVRLCKIFSCISNLLWLYFLILKFLKNSTENTVAWIFMGKKEI